MAALHALAILVSGLLLRNSAQAAASPEDSAQGGVGDWDMFTNGLQVMYSAYQTCEKQEELVSCLKLRALRSADRALRQEKVPLLGGLSFVKEEGRAGRRLADLPPQLDEQALPQDPADRQRALDDLLLDRVDRFFKGHTLQMDTARLLGDNGEYESEAEEGNEDGSVEEGRRKKGFKKYGGALLLGLMMKGGLMAMAWKGVALMAAKALMVAKIALVLSAVVALKKLSHGGHGDEKVTYEIVKHPHVTHSQTFSTGHDYGGHFEGGSGGGGGGGGGGGHYKRSLTPLDIPQSAHLLAYSAHPHPHPLPHAHVRPHYHVHAARQPLPLALHQTDHLAHFHYPAPEQLRQQQLQQQQQQLQQQQVQQQQLQQLQQQQQQQPQQQQQQQQQQEYQYQYDPADQTQEGDEDRNQPVYPYPQQ